MLAKARARAFLLAGVLPALIAPAPPVAAQGETHRGIAGRPSYEASGFHELWFGKDYRDLWTTSFDMPVLDLATFAGGLVPVRQVGNMQSIGLAMRGNDGRSYTFRTMDKDPTRILPEQWRTTWPARIFQDQTVANHPGTAFVVPALAEAAGVPHTSPRVVFMPDSPALGEFRKTFGGKSGTIEEYPTPRSESYGGFLGASEIISTGKLWERWLTGDVDVDTTRYLRGRMLDLVMGDWDRHNLQVRFLRGPGQPAWLALPEDRDQAFSDFSGLLLSLARQTVPKLVKWDDEYSNMRGLLFQGAEVDRWLLSATERPSFTLAAREVMAALTDEVISGAVKRMPPEWQALRGGQMAKDLKRRRDLLPAAADAFYEALAEVVDVRGTDGPDQVRLRRDGEGGVLVEIRTEGAPDPWFRRRFLKKETSEIRLYLHGGADTLTTEGPRGGIKVRVSGGAGTDRLDDSASGGTLFYDVEGAEVEAGPGTKVSTAPYEVQLYKDQTPWLEVTDFGGIAPKQFLVWWEPDPGVVLSASKAFYRYGFRKHPYAQMHRFAVEYKIGRETFAVSYDGDYRWSRPGFSTQLELWGDGAKNYNFYGIGNDTVDDGTTNYEAHQTQYYAFPSLAFASPSRPFELRVGPVAKFSADSSADGSFIQQDQPYGFGDYGQLGARMTFDWDTRRAPGKAKPGAGLLAGGVPKRTGIKMELDGAIYPAAWDVEETFGAIEGSLAGYWGVAPWLTLAGRVGGRHVEGTHPWHESAFIGGSPNVKGYDRNRWAGDSSLYTNAEARIGIGATGVFIPARWGLLAIADGGRVWVEGEESSTWRPAYGGGIWVQLLTLNMTGYGAIMQGRDHQGVKFYANYGFAF